VASLVSTHHKAVRINKTEWNKAYGLIVNVEHLLAAYLCRLTKIKSVKLALPLMRSKTRYAFV